jgi:predicted transcriptional regulator YheO
MRDLVQSLGPDCELALHDFRDVSSSLINVGGPVTGRAPAVPLADLVLRILHHIDDPPDLVTYQPQTSDGRPLRSSIFFVRDDHDSVFGCLCLDREMPHQIVARNLLEDFCQTHPLDNSESGSQETFIHDMEGIL